MDPLTLWLATILDQVGPVDAMAQLREFGGWAVAVFLGLAVIYLDRRYARLTKEIRDHDRDVIEHYEANLVKLSESLDRLGENVRTLIRDK